MLSGIWRDLVHAARALAKAPGFTFVCVVSLGIGMGPVIAVPYLSQVLSVEPRGVQTDGLVEVLTTRVGPRAATDVWSYPDYADLRDAKTGTTLVGWTYGQGDVNRESVRTMFVSGNYFQTIGVALFRGPGFGANGESGVVIGYTYWQNHFASDPDIVGKTLTLDSVSYTITGVAPDQFDSHLPLNGQIAVYLPLERHPRFRAHGTDRSNRWLLIHGRLDPGVTAEQASAAVSTVTASLAGAYPATNENTSGIAAPYAAFGNLLKSQMFALQAVGLTFTGMILLVVCMNISGMVQVRSAIRERELSIRQAIGATRRQLIRYLLADAVIMAVLGAILASFVLFNLPALVSLLSDEPLPALIQDALNVDLSTVAFAFGLCLVTSLVFGLLPALRFSRPAILSALKDDVGVGGRRVGRVQRVTAALQVAIAVPLIVMSGIQLDRVRSTASADLGFAADQLYAVPLKIDADRVPNAASRIRGVRDDLATANGVAGATLADNLPLTFQSDVFRTALQPDANAAPKFFQAYVTRVDTDYLKTMDIPIVRGRGFSAEDQIGSEMVAIITRACAERLFPNADVGEAIGKRLVIGQDEAATQSLTVVGVTGDFPSSQMSNPREQLLLPLAQHPSQELFLIARSVPGESPQKMTATLENAARDFDPDHRGFGVNEDGSPAYPKVVTGAWLRKKSMDDFLTASAVAAGAGGIILTLSALGIYGVVGLMVATRTRELAVRVALGASRRRVIGMVLFDVVRLVLPGIVVGVVLTVALVRLNGENMGIPLSNVEPLAYIFGGAVAVLVAVLASLGPARRAASVQPMATMRTL